MPKLLLFLLKNIALGIIVGWSFAGALLYFDVGGFGSLVLGSSSKYIALALLGGGFAVTFGSASVASAVLLGNDFIDDFYGNDRDDGNGVIGDELALAQVRARAGKH